MLLKFDVNKNLWYIENVNILKADRTLYSGVSVDVIKNLLTNKTIENYIERIDVGYLTDFNWNINDEEEIEQVDILEQKTNLNDYTDQVKLQIELKKGNITAEGTVDIQFTYDENYGWKISNLKTIKPFDYLLTQDINVDKNSLNQQLIGKRFSYKDYFFGNSWTIEEGEIKKLIIKKKTPLNYGETFVLTTDLELKSSEDTISGEVYIVFSLEDNEWKLEQIKRVNNFISK